MQIDLENLPTEINILQEIITALNIENQYLLSENITLKEQLEILRARKFGKSSEKLNKEIEQLEFLIEENEQECAKAEAIVTGTKEKQAAKRQKLPEHLSREDVIINPEPNCPECGGSEFRKIADDISETLEYVPSSFKVIRHIRPRCACIACEKIVQAYAPSKAIDKGKAGPGLLAHILVQKYCNHLPIYRQHQMYLREGIEIAKSTMTGWAGECVKLLQPLIIKLQQAIFSSSYLHGDDTPVRVLAPGLGKTRTGRIWVYVRDGRPYGDEAPPAVCYFYSPDRKGERPSKHLQDFRGILHADSYAGYNNLYISEENPRGAITEAACWAHTRRKFYEVTIANDKANIAISVLEEISKIYQIEGEIRGLEPEKRLEYRQRQSKELVEKLFNNFRKYRKELPLKSVTAKAIAYALNNEVALKRFLEDGKIEIDNNAAERAIRSIAIGRKNWLFAGSDNGGNTTAGIYSLLETAKMNNINPHQYLHKVLSVIQDYNSHKMADLLPWNITL